MIIDIHGHIRAPSALYEYKTMLISGHGYHTVAPEMSDDLVRSAMQKHVQLLETVGTDLQLISARPFQLMHSQKPPAVVRLWVEANNSIIARQCKLYPTLFRGVCALPQTPGVSPVECVDELERCVDELGFVGTMINPDPGEGDNTTPPLGDEYWYPLYQKMVDLDVPGLVHAASCHNGRESYSNHFITEESIGILSLVDSNVFRDFPTLKLVFPHGGGSVPYQIGRWRARRWSGGAPKKNDFDEDLRKLYFDTVLYNKESLDLLFKIVGTDRVMFGTENPGSGSSRDPVTGHLLDDLKPVVESVEWLSEQDKQRVFEDNARAVYTRLRL